MNKQELLQLHYYVPASHHEALKAALFAAGAGQYGNYDQCCWQTVGMGQFRPLSGSNPYCGNQNCLHQVEEIKVEMICQAQYIDAVIETLQTHHPYEQPAYFVIKSDHRNVGADPVSAFQRIEE